MEDFWRILACDYVNSITERCVMQQACKLFKQLFNNLKYGIYLQYSPENDPYSEVYKYKFASKNVDYIMFVCTEYGINNTSNASVSIAKRRVFTIPVHVLHQLVSRHVDPDIKEFGFDDDNTHCTLWNHLPKERIEHLFSPDFKHPIGYREHIRMFSAGDRDYLFLTCSGLYGYEVCLLLYFDKENRRLLTSLEWLYYPESREIIHYCNRTLGLETAGSPIPEFRVIGDYVMIFTKYYITFFNHRTNTCGTVIANNWVRVPDELEVARHDSQDVIYFKFDVAKGIAQQIPMQKFPHSVSKTLFL